MAKRSPCNAAFRLSHISARRLAGPLAVLPVSSNGGGSTGLPPNDAAGYLAVALLFNSIGNTHNKAANINIYFNRLIVADNFSNQTRHFHRIKAMTLFYLGDAVPLPPSNGCTVCTLSRRVNAND